MAIPYEHLSEDVRDAFRYISKKQLVDHVGEFINIIWFKDKKTMDQFHERAGPKFNKTLGPDKTGVVQSAKTGKFIQVFWTEGVPFLMPGYKVEMEGVEMKSLMLYP